MSLTSDDDQLQPRQAYGPAEVDDGTHGIHAIPAMLRLLRSHLVTHTDAVTKSRDRVNSVLSTVMGSFDPGGIETKEFKKLMKDQALSELNDYVLVPKTSDDDLSAEQRSRAAKELRLLVNRVAAHQNKIWAQTLIPVMERALNEDAFDPITESIDAHVKSARALAAQCVKLYSGQKAAQPFKREAAQTLYEKQTKFLAEKLLCINTNRKHLTEARELRMTLTQNVEFEALINDADLSAKVARCDSTISTLTQNIQSLSKELVAEFNNGVYPTSEHKRVDLNIPTDILEKSRGQWVRQEIPAWFRNHANELYPVIPYVNRIINDYDPLTGEYWKPPTLTEAEDKIPQAYREEWEKANRSLATKLINSMSNGMLTKITSSYEYGSNQDKTARADHEDGLSLVFAIVTLSSPNTTEYRDDIDRKMHSCADLAASGNPTDFVKTVRGLLAEAVRLNLPVKWHVAKQIINHLSSRNALFARDLGPSAASCTNQDDSAEQFDALLTKIENTNTQIKNVNGDAWWVSNPRAHNAKAYTGKPEEICRFGKDCRNKSNGLCNRDHSKKGKGKGAGKGKDGKGATKTFSGKNSKERGECVGKDCPKEKSPNGDLCGDCWTKAKADGGYTNQYGKRVNITANGKNKKPKAEANMAKGNNTSGPLAIEAAPSNVFIAAADYEQFAKFKQFMASGKVSSERDFANAMSVTGEALKEFITGPASYKQSQVENFLKYNSIVNEPIKLTIDRFIKSRADQ